MPALKKRIRELEKSLQESEQTAAHLRESEATFRFLSENMDDIAFMVDMSLRTTYVTPSVEKILGFTPAKRRSQRIEEQISAHSLQLVSKVLTEELEREKSRDADPNRSRTMTLEYYHKDGSLRNLETSFRGIRDGNGVLSGFCGLARDITERKKAEEALRESEKRYRELSMIDDLTQLYNSRLFYAQLKRETDRASRYAQPLTLLLLDLDDFKQFNDAYGHIEGDHVLLRLGRVIKECLRQTDSPCRYGGEEFAILLPMTTGADGVVTAERIRTTFKKEAFCPTAGGEIHVTVSIGLAQYRPGEETKAFVHRADQLMYQAKSGGKDRVCAEPST